MKNVKQAGNLLWYIKKWTISNIGQLQNDASQVEGQLECGTVSIPEINLANKQTLL